MYIWYDEMIENIDLGYTLYLDLKEDKEYWYNHNTSQLFPCKEAGEVLYGVPIMSNFTLKRRVE